MKVPIKCRCGHDLTEPAPTPTGGQVEAVQLGECNVKQREDLLAENAALREEVAKLKQDGAILADECTRLMHEGNAEIDTLTAELARLREERKGLQEWLDSAVTFAAFALSESPVKPDSSTGEALIKSIIDAVRLESRDELSTLRATNAGLVEATGALLQYAEIHECQHEETHRGGAIWTICDRCGRKWADDTGGFQPYQEPPQFEAARAALDAAKGGEG